MKAGKILLIMSPAVFCMGWINSCTPMAIEKPFNAEGFWYYTIISVVLLIVGAILYDRKKPKKSYKKKVKNKPLEMENIIPCGKRNTEESKAANCESCGALLLKGATYCGNCGMRILSKAGEKNEKVS